MNKFYTPQHIANFFLDKSNHSIDNLKLNKLIYISFGWVYAIIDREIFQEPIQAWRFGPVIPSIYHEFKDFRYNVINRLSKIYDIWFSYDKVGHTPKIDVDDKELLDLMEKVYSEYGNYNANELVQMTHAKGTPWAEVYQENDFNIEIPKNKIKEYYQKLIDD